MRLRVLARLLQIQRVLVRHGLDEFVREAHLLRPLRFAFYLSPATWFERSKGGSRGVRIREALEEAMAAMLGECVSWEERGEEEEERRASARERERQDCGAPRGDGAGL